MIEDMIIETLREKFTLLGYYSNPKKVINQFLEVDLLAIKEDKRVFCEIKRTFNKDNLKKGIGQLVVCQALFGQSHDYFLIFPKANILPQNPRTRDSLEEDYLVFLKEEKTASEMARQFNVTRNTACERLNQLAWAGVVNKTRKNRKIYFTLCEQRPTYIDLPDGRTLTNRDDLKKLIVSRLTTLGVKMIFLDPNDDLSVYLSEKQPFVDNH